jgi:hypothetical protein
MIKFSGTPLDCNLRSLVQIQAWHGTDALVRSLNQSWDRSLDWRSTDLSIRRINPHGEIRRIANACPAGEHRLRHCSFFLGFLVYGIKLIHSRLLRSSMEQSPLPHSAPPRSFAVGLGFNLRRILQKLNLDRGF